MLLRATLALTLVFAGYRVQAEDDPKTVYQGECTDYFKSKYTTLMTKRCCNLFIDSDLLQIKSNDENCKFSSPGEEWKCEDSECFLQQRGISSAGKIDHKKAAERLDMLNKISPDLKHMTDRMEKTCNSIEKLALLPSTGCPATDYHVCATYSWMVDCTKPNVDDEDCVDLVKKSIICSAAIEKITANK